MYIYIYIGDLLAEFGSSTRLHCLPSVRVSRQVRNDEMRSRSEGKVMLAHECAASIENNSMRARVDVELKSSKHQACESNGREVVMTNSENKVGMVTFTIILRCLSKGSIHISPKNLALSIVNDRIIMDFLMCWTMHTSKDARPAYELMHTMGSRPTVENGLEHMGLDVGEERGISKFHKEIGPVEVGEGGRGGVTEDPHGSKFQISASEVLLDLGKQGFIYVGLGFG